MQSTDLEGITVSVRNSSEGGMIPKQPRQGFGAQPELLLSLEMFLKLNCCILFQTLRRTFFYCRLEICICSFTYLLLFVLILPARLNHIISTLFLSPFQEPACGFQLLFHGCSPWGQLALPWLPTPQPFANFHVLSRGGNEGC